MNTDDNKKCFEPGAKEKVLLVSSESSTTGSPRSLQVLTDTKPLLSADTAAANEDILTIEGKRYLGKSGTSTNDNSSLQNPQNLNPEVESNKDEEHEEMCLSSIANHDQNDEESPEVPGSDDSPAFCTFLKNKKITLALLLCIVFIVIGVSIGYVSYKSTSSVLSTSSPSNTPSSSPTPTVSISPSTIPSSSPTRYCMSAEEHFRNFWISKDELNDLELIVYSMVLEQEDSFYCKDDFDPSDALEWFLDRNNHPSDMLEQIDFMKERLILALIYFANCKDECVLDYYDWLSANDHCDWTRLICNASKEITFLQLRSSALSSEFTLFRLKSLEDLYLDRNSLSGTFTVAGRCENLKKASLTNNKLTGFVGGKILTNLESLSLGSNAFEGDFIVKEDNLPTSIKDLRLDGNKLTGFVGGKILTNLESLSLGSNEFEGDFIVNDENFPTSIKGLFLEKNKLTGFVGGKSLTNLEGLGLQQNEFEGDFIVKKDNLPTSITSLNFYGNKLTGFVGGGILTNLESLLLSYNEFEGDFIITAENFPTSITSLYLFGNNKLTGFVGGGILTNLESLDLSDYELEGDFIVKEEDIPTSIKSLNLNHNKLTGFVGGGILTNLESLYLTSNEFEGDFIVNGENIPTSIKSLALGKNKLTGFVGGKILTNLESLYLTSNEFEGDFIVKEENIPTSIRRLYLHENKLTGFVGGEILTNLEFLQLASNEFVGDFIITAENFPGSMTSLRLDYNIGLASVDAESNAVPVLVNLNVGGIEGIAVTEELCNRVIYIEPSYACA